MATGKKAASISGKKLGTPSTSKPVKTIAASDLSQAKTVKVVPKKNPKKK